MEEGEGDSSFPLPSPPSITPPMSLPPPSSPLAGGELPLEVFDNPNEPVNEEEAPSTPSPILTDDLCEKIVRQVEYYFSDANLPTDNFLLKFVKKNKQGFVPIAVIASFRKMKKLTQDNSLIEAALRTSSQLVVSVDGKRVRRLHPLCDSENEDAKSRTVLVKNLPENQSIDNIQTIFGNIGNIKNISIQGPQILEGSEATKERLLISNKMHALIEYETIEAAKNAVANLNDESNWRSGMRVELLKRMDKHGLAPRGQKGTISGNNNSIQASSGVGRRHDKKSSDSQEEMAEREEEIVLEEKNEKRTRNKRRGRVHQQSHIHERGQNLASSGFRECMNKPAPGPRMPDGTRGFTMGRGKPIVQKSAPEFAE